MSVTPRPRTAPHIGIAALFALPILLVGCSTSTISVNPTAEGLAVPARLPLTIGIYYAPEFRAYESVCYRPVLVEDCHPKGVRALIFPVGQASVTLLDQALALLFERSVPFPANPAPATVGPPVAAILEPTLVEFHYGWSGYASPAFRWTEVTHRFLLRSPQGDLVASWTVTGAGKADAWDQAFERALRDAVRQFVATFRAVPEVQQWLQGGGGARGSAGRRREE